MELLADYPAKATGRYTHLARSIVLQHSFRFLIHLSRTASIDSNEAQPIASNHVAFKPYYRDIADSG